MACALMIGGKDLRVLQLLPDIQFWQGLLQVIKLGRSLMRCTARWDGAPRSPGDNFSGIERLQSGNLVTIGAEKTFAR